MEISPSLFDIEEVSQVSSERVERLKEEILRRYQEKTQEHAEARVTPQGPQAERAEQSG